METARQYLVRLEEIAWDIDGYETESEEVNLPERMEFIVDAYNEDDALDVALDEASEKTGFLIYGSFPVIILL